MLPILVNRDICFCKSSFSSTIYFVLFTIFVVDQTRTNQTATQSVMLSNEEFEGIPPFPNDVPTAPLLRLSLDLLLARDPKELSRFFSACENLGFFYLKLSSCSEGRALLDEADNLFQVGEDLFELPVEEKTTYDFSKSQNSYFGYKGYGANVIDKKGNLDRNEYYNVSKDDILGHGKQWPHPKVLDANRKLMEGFINGSHGIV